MFLVRKGNPKGIHDWDDLAKPGVSVITPNPKTSGGARWNYLAAWAYGEKKSAATRPRRKDFVAAIYKNVPVLDTGARGSTITFAQRGLGDVLIAWENDALPRQRGIRQGPVRDRRAVAVDPRRAAGRGGRRNVDAKGTRKLAEAYLQFLYTPAAQEIIAKNYFRPAHPEFADPDDLKRFPKLDLVTVDGAFGGWKKAQATHFADGGVFDQIQQGGRIERHDPVDRRRSRSRSRAPLPGFAPTLGVHAGLSDADRAAAAGGADRQGLVARLRRPVGDR